MAFLRAERAARATQAIKGDGIILRPAKFSDYSQWAELRTLSRLHLAPWEPRWVRNELTHACFKRRLRFYEREAREDHGYAFLLFSTDRENLVGGVTLSHVRRGVSQSAMLGYWLGVGYTGQGLMTRAVRAVIPHAFQHLKLHRLEAAVQPHNVASIGVLERNGFEREGVLRKYLKIDGRWQDHVLYARLEEDARQSASRDQ